MGIFSKFKEFKDSMVNTEKKELQAIRVLNKRLETMEKDLRPIIKQGVKRSKEEEELCENYKKEMILVILGKKEKDKEGLAHMFIVENDKGEFINKQDLEKFNELELMELFETLIKKWAESMEIYDLSKLE